MTKTLQNV